MKTSPAVYAVILAGGGGTRLWPLSRTGQPKHLLSFCGESTMLAQTSARVLPLVPVDQQMVITVAEHVQTVSGQLPDILPQNMVVEPVGRSTGPCIGLMALLIHKRDPEAIMISLHADHAVADEEKFRSVVRAAVRMAEGRHLVTLGIVPTRPETGYGYIRRGEPLGQAEGHHVYRVERFTEKPDLETARSFVQSGCYFWNSGIFVWKVSVILAQIQRLLPELYSQLMEIEPALDTPEQANVMERVWGTVHSVPVDIGIIEKASDVVVIPADIGWSDVGCWTSVASLLPTDKDGNALQGENVVLDCQDSLVYSSGRLVAALGLRGMVVIETEDAVLVCPKERVQDVKRIVETLKQQRKDEYL